MTMRVLVTGGAGFIGSHLVDALIARGDQVVVLDDFSSGSTENLTGALAGGNVRLVEGSVLDRVALDDAIAGCAQVYHLAVQCVRRSLGRPIENHDVNATGTLLTLEAARQAGVGRFLYCSSSEVYGNCGGERLSEETRPQPVTVYGAAKLAGEHYASAYYQTYGLPTVIVRPFNSYGPREHDRGDLAEVIPRFVIRVSNGLPPVIFGSGENGRDFTYVTETAEGILRAADSEALLGKIVNIAYGQMVRVKDVARSVARVCGRPDLEPVSIEPRPGDVMALQAHTGRAKSALGFEARIPFETGLKQYVGWFRDRYPDPRSLLEADVRNWEMPSVP